MAHRRLSVRIAVSLMIGGAGAGISAIKIAQVEHTSDYAVFWLAARALIHADNPYAAVYAGVRPWITSGFLYPLPAAMVVAPTAVFPERIGAVLFAGMGLSILAFAITMDGYQRLPLLMSLPVLLSLTSVQWAPLVTAAAFAPGFAWGAVCKPNLGIAIFASRPSLRFALVAGAFLAVSLALRPSWPAEWLRSLSTAVPGSKVMPVSVPGGALLLLAVARWRRPEARLLCVLACVPQTMLGYDQLLLAAVCITFREALVMGLWSYGVPLGTYLVLRDHMPASDAGSYQLLARMFVWGYYLPALVLVVRRPNRGDVPTWLQRRVASWPAWIQGSAT